MNRHATTPSHAAKQDAADAREFDDFARGQDPVLLEAALWATRRSEAMDAAAEAQFQAWLGAAPEHATAYDQMAHSTTPAQALPPARIQALRNSLPRRSAPAQRDRPKERSGWLAGLAPFFPQAATAMAAVALVAGGWLGWNHYAGQPTFEKHYATERGQRLDIALPDGSTLQLDAATQADVRLYRDRREVRLAEGQAMFAVQADTAQPFSVFAGPMRVTVVGTRFSVRHTQAGMDAGHTVVAVESGRVRVAPAVADGAPAKVELGAGQSVTADAAGQLQAVTSVAPASVAGWRQGRISFNDTPLSAALAELERYGDTRLVLRDPAVGALRLGGSVDLRQVGTFAQALPSLLPVRLAPRNGQMEIVAQR